MRTQNKTHNAHDTATTNQLHLALRYVTSRYCTEPYTQTLSSNDDVSKRHDKSLLGTQIMTDAWLHTTCFRSWHDTCTTLESIPRRHELAHITTTKEHMKQHDARPFYLGKKRTSRGDEDNARHFCWHVPRTEHFRTVDVIQPSAR